MPYENINFECKAGWALPDMKWNRLVHTHIYIYIYII